MAKIGELEIIPPSGTTTTGFTSVRNTNSSVMVDCIGEYGVRVAIERGEDPVINQTVLTVEEAWVLYTSLRSKFYETRQRERNLYNNKYNFD